MKETRRPVTISTNKYIKQKMPLDTIVLLFATSYKCFRSKKHSNKIKYDCFSAANIEVRKIIFIFADM